MEKWKSFLRTCCREPIISWRMLGRRVPSGDRVESFEFNTAKWSVQFLLSPSCWSQETFRKTTWSGEKVFVFTESQRIVLEHSSISHWLIFPFSEESKLFEVHESSSEIDVLNYCLLKCIWIVYLNRTCILIC